MPKIADILIPVYNNIDLVRDCIESIKANIDEIADYYPRLIIVNDSPDNQELNAYLAACKASGTIDLLIENEVNLGFVKSVNKGLDAARQRGSDVLLVNSDTRTFPGTMREVFAVAETDEQIAFVCPRSNNASISTFPIAPHNMAGRTIEPDHCYAAWKSVAHYLPRYSFAPTGVGFYLFIKSVVIQNFGGLDEEFGVGYEEENDLVTRANKVGFRAVMANHAYAYHAGSASFALQNMNLDTHRKANLEKLNERHPEFLDMVRAFDASPGYRAEQQIRKLVPDTDGRIIVALNLLNMGCYFNGTNELILNVIRAVDALDLPDLKFVAVTDQATAKFHGIDKLKNVRFSEIIKGNYGVAIHFGQPYNLHLLNVMDDMAPIVLYGMLDAISYDCGYLNVSQKMTPLWEATTKYANGLYFISEFGKRTFANRFAIGEHSELYPRLLSTKLADYADRYRDAERGSTHVFIAGNHFLHKDAKRTVLQLARQYPSVQFCVMDDGMTHLPNVRSLQAGLVSDDEMIDVIAKASVVVLPSYYEGFGFSLMHALALGKPVVARDIPATREILDTFASHSGVILFTRDKEIGMAVRVAMNIGQSTIDDSPAQGWDEWSLGFVDWIRRAVHSPHVYTTLVERIRNLDKLRVINHLENIVTTGLPTKASPEVFRPKTMAAIRAMSNEDFITYLYQRVLERAPDEDGLEHHTGKLDSGESRRAAIRGFLNSEEYRAKENRPDASELRWLERYYRVLG